MSSQEEKHAVTERELSLCFLSLIPPVEREASWAGVKAFAYQEIRR